MACQGTGDIWIPVVRERVNFPGKMQIYCRFNVSYKGQIVNKILKVILEMWVVEMWK
jgi:hypothetical protein